ncbi:MAG: hypothetical protein LBE34_13250 [Flavobacteriaceae bacterium]|nr:hypothetical protein [Flavobacteriaceae bacterium]
MRRILSHIISLLILLSLVGVKVLDTAQANYISTVYTSTLGVDYPLHGENGEVHKKVKEYRTDNSFSSIETDNGDDVSVQDFVLLATLTKVFVCAIFIHFVLYAYRRRRSFYEVFIQLFDHKYIVYHTLRI